MVSGVVSAAADSAADLAVDSAAAEEREGASNGNKVTKVLEVS